MSQILGLQGEPGARSGQVQDEPGSGVSGIQSTYWSIMRGPLLQYGYRVIVVSHCEVLTTGADSQ